MKKLLSLILVLAIVSIVPVLAGCEQNEATYQTKSETTGVKSQDTVVK